jgi:Spy/CpxP family protein refolding chaperone
MRGGRGGPGGPLGILGPEMRALELTDAQREQIRGVLAPHQEAFQAIGREMAEARRGLHQAITADAENPDVIGAAVQLVSAVELKAALLRAQVHREVWAQLTPEQQEKAKALKADAEKRMKERTERMRERRK